MTRKIIDNIRKIVDRTPQVNVTVIDKSPIESSRGVDEFLRDKVLRQDIEGTYTFAQIIDNIDGPTLHEDSNTEDPYDHVARITEMVDPEFTSLTIKLKPDGVFD